MLGKYHMKLLIKTIQYWKEFMIHRNSRKDQLVFVTKHHDNSLKLRALMSFSQHLVTKSGKIAAYRNAKNYRNHILLQKYARFLIGFYFHEQKYIKIRKQIQANQPVHSMTHHMHA